MPFAHAWKANKADTGHTRLCNIESDSSSTPRGCWGNELSSQLGHLCLEPAKMVRRGLVLLGAGHFSLNVLDLLENAHC